MRVQRGHIRATPHELFSLFTLAFYFWVLAFTLNRDHLAVSFGYHVKIKYINYLAAQEEFSLFFFFQMKKSLKHTQIIFTKLFDLLIMLDLDLMQTYECHFFVICFCVWRAFDR